MNQWRLVFAKAKSTITALAKKMFWFITHNAFLSTIAIVIASATYFDAKTSGAEQKKALEESRKALSEVVSSLKTQNKIQENQLDRLVATDDLARNERNRHPEIKFNFQKIPASGINFNPAAKKLVDISRSDQRGIFVLYSNVGNKALESPSIRITAFPETISFLLSGAPQNIPNMVEYIKMSNVERVSTSNIPYAIVIHMNIPEDVSAVDLSAEIYGANMVKKTSSIHLNVTP